MSITWNEIFVKILKEKNRPMSSNEILQDIIDNKKNDNHSLRSARVALSNAKTQGILASIKIPPAKGFFYCNPNWLENGILKKEYNHFDPFWDLLNTPKTENPT